MDRLRDMKNISFTQLVLTVLFVTALLISNTTAAKQVLLFGKITITSAEFIFPLTYVLSDVFSEVYGYRWSRLTCYLGFGANLIMVLFFQMTIITPAPQYWAHQEAFKIVLGNTPRIWIASMFAFLMGDLVNDKIFKRMKEKYANSHEKFWQRAIVSSFVGEIVDSSIFLPIAFIGQMPFKNLVTMMIFQTLVKTLYEVIILPITYKVVKIVSKIENSTKKHTHEVLYSFDNRQIRR